MLIINSALSISSSLRPLTAGALPQRAGTTTPVRLNRVVVGARELSTGLHARGWTRWRDPCCACCCKALQRSRRCKAQRESHRCKAQRSGKTQRSRRHQKPVRERRFALLAGGVLVLLRFACTQLREVLVVDDFLVAVVGCVAPRGRAHRWSPIRCDAQRRLQGEHNHRRAPHPKLEPPQPDHRERCSMRI